MGTYFSPRRCHNDWRFRDRQDSETLIARGLISTSSSPVASLTWRPGTYFTRRTASPSARATRTTTTTRRWTSVRPMRHAAFCEIAPQSHSGRSSILSFMSCAGNPCLVRPGDLYLNYRPASGMKGASASRLFECGARWRSSSNRI